MRPPMERTCACLNKGPMFLGVSSVIQMFLFADTGVSFDASADANDAHTPWKDQT